MRKAWHQLDPIKMSKAAFEKLPDREDSKGERYVDGQKYRAKQYPNEYFVWKAYPKGAETKGEWQMGAVELT